MQQSGNSPPCTLKLSEERDTVRYDVCNAIRDISSATMVGPHRNTP